MEAAFICSEELWSRGFGVGHLLMPERLSAPRGEGEERALAERYGFRSDETPAFAGMFETESLKVGAGLVEAELVAGERRACGGGSRATGVWKRLLATGLGMAGACRFAPGDRFGIIGQGYCALTGWR